MIFRGSVTAALKDTPAIMVIGPRQCGKTTLAREPGNISTLPKISESLAGRMEIVTLLPRYRVRKNAGNVPHSCRMLSRVN